MNNTTSIPLIDLAANSRSIKQDVLDALSREKVRVLAARSSGREPDVRLLFTLEVSGAGGIGRVVEQLRHVQGVSGARRR